MFTGIIHHLGRVKSLADAPFGKRITIHSGELAGELPIGASVAVNGVCLTVAQTSPPAIGFDVIPETLGKTTLGDLLTNDVVNLEPSLRAGDAIDGHFVQGHVDGTARVVRIDQSAGQHVVWLEPESNLLPYLIPKGSVAIEGVSLTIADRAPSSFSIALIPTTLDRTTLSRWHVGRRVNVETDIVVRTVVAHLSGLTGGNDQDRSAAGALSMDSLVEGGFA